MDEVECIEIVTLVDNYVDIFLPDNDIARYPKPGLLSSLVAEQGVSIFLRTLHKGKELRILYDFGRSEDVLTRNAPLLNIPLDGGLDYLVLSHGHADHYGSLVSIINKWKSHKPTIITHPDVFFTRYMKFKNGREVGPWQLNMDILRERGELIQSKEVIQLEDGVITSGEIERHTDFEPEMEEAYRVEGEKVVHDRLMDDTSLIINIKGKGLILITGCAHAGLVNIIYHAIKLTGIDRIYGIIGGFHLNHSSEKQLKKTMKALKELDVKFLSPMHCTGFHAIREISCTLRASFVPHCVGTKIVIDSTTD